MIDHLYYRELHNPADDTIKIKDLKYLLREEREVDDLIRKQFPLDSFDDLFADLNIKGSKALMDAFNSSYDQKMDILTSFGDVEYIGLDDKDEIILNFKNDDINASGIYNFTYTFLEEFSMGKFGIFCIKEGYNDILKDNLVRLFKEMKDKEKQYRLIKKNEEYFLRGLTSNRYNNYDNHIALYLTLLSLHKFSKDNKIEYKVKSAYLSESAMSIFFEQEKPTLIPEVGNIYFGAAVNNSEIRESAYNFELRYRIEDLKDKTKQFSAIPNLMDSVFTLSHGMGIEKVAERVQNIFRLKQLQNSMLEFVVNLRKVKVLTAEIIFVLYRKIIYNKYFTAATKSRFKEIHEKNLVKNTLSLIEAFNLVNTVTTDFDERIFLERIYHEIITEITSGREMAG